MAIADAYSDSEARARKSLGASDAAIYTMVAGALAERQAAGLLADVGCGVGNLLPFVRNRFDYVGVDVVRYEGFPLEAKFCQAELDSGKVPLADGSVDVVAAVEVIEHLENPRAFMRELVRLAKPGGWIVVTTPNQLSFLSLVTLVVKHRFSDFQDVHYPAHLTALLEVDLCRIAAECGLSDVNIAYSFQGRIVLTPWRCPRFLSRLFPRALSDNLLLIGRAPGRFAARETGSL
ncbi:MAG TPA: class I SAM-dependent methyltransferase [Pyrinomonadaceae bacterium]|jgi:2-polyprenyl-3-methyl-5-hydroxy-6-metoxy-1,4-benzoquinol methylase|nr:class I SAM-dependent methyltransferase [Pyrinomonadaceae bacterium]